MPSAAALQARATRALFVTHTLFDLAPLALRRRHRRFRFFAAEARRIVMRRICMLRTMLKSKALKQHEPLARGERAACLGTNPLADRKYRVRVVHEVLGVAHVRLVQLWVHLELRDGHRDSLGHEPGLGHDAREYCGAHHKLRRCRRRRQGRRKTARPRGIMHVEKRTGAATVQRIYGAYGDGRGAGGIDKGGSGRG